MIAVESTWQASNRVRDRPPTEVFLFFSSLPSLPSFLPFSFFFFFLSIIRRGNSTMQKDSAMRSQCAHLLSVGGEEKDRGDWAIRKKATTDA